MSLQKAREQQRLAHNGPRHCFASWELVGDGFPTALVLTRQPQAWLYTLQGVEAQHVCYKQMDTRRAKDARRLCRSHMFTSASHVCLPSLPPMASDAIIRGFQTQGTSVRISTTTWATRALRISTWLGTSSLADHFGFGLCFGHTGFLVLGCSRTFHRCFSVLQSFKAFFLVLFQRFLWHSLCRHIG